MSPSAFVYSIGYEGRSLDEFLDDLIEHDIDVLVDVRLTPLSRKPGFSKSALRDALLFNEIEYLHERDLGNPKDNRDAFREGKKSASNKFRRLIKRNARETLEELSVLSKRKRIALMCYERDADTCHRKIVAEEMLYTTTRLKQFHIA